MRRGGAGGRRLPKPSLAPSSTADATPMDPLCRNLESAFSRRDSDAASFCSSVRPSPIGVGAPLAAPNFSDRASQAAALRDLNAFLAPFVTLRPPIPSARDIMTAFRLVFERLDYPLQEKDVEDDILFALRALACPYKLNRSALKAPSTPHSWPPLLCVLHWLAILASIDADSDSSSSHVSDLASYTIKSYSYFIEGDDDAVTALDNEYVTKARVHTEASMEAIRALEKKAQEMEEMSTKLTTAPKRCEKLQEQMAAHAEDFSKLESVVATWSAKLDDKEATKVNLLKALEVKLGEMQRLAAENKVLSEKVKAQDVNVQDAEMMHKEVQLLDNDNAKLEKGNETLAEGGWEIDSGLVTKMDELAAIVQKCNQALEKLEPSIDFKYSLNTKGSSLVELLGSSYKTEVKPTLKAYSEESKRISTLGHEELVNLEKQVQENAKIMEELKNNVSSLLNITDEIGVRLNTVDHEIENDESRCKAESVQMTNVFERNESLMNTVEKEGADFLKNCEQKLQDKIHKSDEETQRCAKQLLELMKHVSLYKKFMEDSIARRKKELSETAAYIASLM